MYNRCVWSDPLALHEAELAVDGKWAAQLWVRQGAPGSSMRTLAGRAAAAAAAAAAPVSEVAEVASKLSTGAGMVRDRGGGGGAQGELRHVRLPAGEIRGMTIG